MQSDTISSLFNVPPLPSVDEPGTEEISEKFRSKKLNDKFSAFIEKNIHLVDENVVACIHDITQKTLTDLVNMDESISHLLLQY